MLTRARVHKTSYMMKNSPERVFDTPHVHSVKVILVDLTWFGG